MKTNPLYQRLYDLSLVDPDNLAIIEGTEEYTRKDLIKLIDEIEQQIPKEAQRIGIMMNHSVKMIAAIFAVLKSGKTYIPVEPFFPINRINFIMKDAEVDVILTEEDSKLSILILNQDHSNINNENNKLAYILYTSGSTGKPKGVAVTNSNVLNYVEAFQNEFQLTSNDRMLQYSVCTFDIFVEEVFGSLLNGAILVITPESIRNKTDKLINFINKKKVTIISGFPYLLQDLNQYKKLPSSLRLLISGGDVLRYDYINNLVDNIPIYNTYGPSETTVCATYFRCTDTNYLDDGTYPIGKAIRNVSVSILDENLNPVKLGEIGEIYISGKGVSNGYIGDRVEENKAFIKKDNSILYRSGDMGYQLEDSNLAFLHRKDSQIMIQGRRVEPFEVETVLNNCSEVKQAIVRPYQDNKNLSYMVAYIVFRNNQGDLNNILKDLSYELPDYMIPEYFVHLSELPLNANGKVENSLLPRINK